ncbi:MAG: PAS domain S-box protein [Deltaproteobacteria bacterium]|jgi:PAS domain S-box-containing protein|nr:PAS domain S-box protein [Deltaproteobacteria bacterium]
MAKKPNYEELEKDIFSKSEQIQVSDINIEWNVKQGTCNFENLPVVLMWVDTTLAGLMSGVQSMVGTERFGLALQSEGRKSVDEDWKVISQYSDFQDGFKAIANIAAVAGWGDWELISFDENKKKCQFRVKNSWEGRYQKSLGVCWNSGMLAGKMAGYCSKLFKTNCWTKQTAFIAKGDDFDEFEVLPSKRSIEMEIENLLLSDEATRADMAVALQKLRESEERYRLLADNVTDVIWVRDMNLNLTYISPSVMDQQGYTVEEAKARTLEENWTPDSLKHVGEVFAEELEIEKDKQKNMNRSRTIEVEVNCKGGSTIWTEAKMSFLRNKDGEPIGIIGVTRNITERKQAEDALRESEEKYRSLIERANDGVIIVQDGIVKFVNNRIVDLFGYNVDKMCDTPFLDYVFPDDRKRIKELHERRMKEEDVPNIYEMQALHKEGRKLDIETNSGIITYHGKPAVLAFIRDITERKRTEEALREREATLRSIFRAAPTGIGLVCDRVIKQVNDRLCEMLGYSRKELLDKNARILYPTDKDFEYVGREKYEQISERRTGTVETRWQCKDGKIIDVLLSSTPIDPNDLSIGVTFTALDITERKQAEEALQESEEKYRTVLEANPDPVVVYDIEGKVIYFNPAFTRVFGWTLEECLGNKMDVFVPEESWRETKMMIEKVLSGKRFSGIETHRYNKNGEIIPVSISGAIYKDQNGKPIGSVINLRDITEQKKLEAQLQQAQKMESIGTLAGGIAHDFNNILGIIVGNAELALDDISERDRVHINLEEIRTACLRAKDVVKQLLSFARKTDLKQKSIKLIPVVKDSIKLLRAIIPKNIDIHQNITDTSDTIFADPTQIHQIMINLCTNASHAMQDTGGILGIDIENVLFEEDLDALHPDLIPGTYVKLTVSDTGQGINPELKDKIFDPYFTTKEIGKGTGMGLSVVHGIVKNYGGRISVESELGKGTTFYIYFPVMEEEAVIETETDEELPKGNERILFVDDEKSIIYVGRYRLERLGYQVVTQTNPVEALELFRANPYQFDLVITDMTMPQMTGDHLVEEILKIRPDTPTILCTGFSEKIDEEKAEEIGATGYVEKPVDKRNFAIKIRSVLDRKKV